MPDEGWRRIAEAGTKVTLATTSEQQLGLSSGVPAIQDALDHGIRPCLSGDVAADMFWLGIMVERVYRPVLGEILSTSANLPRGYRVLSDLPGRTNNLFGAPGCAASVGELRRALWWSRSAFSPMPLRLDQPGDVAQLADAFDGRRSRFGLCARCIGGNDWFYRGQPILAEGQFREKLSRRDPASFSDNLNRPMPVKNPA